MERKDAAPDSDTQDIPILFEASDSEGEGDEDIPKLQRNVAKGDHILRRVTGQAPQYAGLYCTTDGDKDILDEDVSSIVNRDECFLSSVDPNTTGSSPATSYLEQHSYLSLDGIVEDTHPYVFSAKVQSHDSDNPTYKDIMQLPEEERKLWDDSMVKELKSLRDLGSFKMVSRPSDATILASTWAFRKKRYPDGALKKFKARFCVHGDLQIDGLDVFETFSPVVAWITVIILLILSIVLNLETQQVDYANAFCQAPLDQTIFVELPAGFESPNKVLLLEKSVYGLQQSPLNFYNHLRHGLESRGLVKSNHDDCLFTNGETIV